MVQLSSILTPSVCASEISIVTLAWFTYDTELPPRDAIAHLGDAGHRWLTALGAITDKQGTVAIRRVVNDNIVLCEMLNAD